MKEGLKSSLESGGEKKKEEFLKNQHSPKLWNPCPGQPAPAPHSLCPEGTDISSETPVPSPISESILVFPREKAPVSPPGIFGRLPEVGKSGARSGSAGGAGTERSVTVRGSLRSNLFRDKS